MPSSIESKAPDIANALLTGIITDTLAFRTTNTTPDTLAAAMELMGKSAQDLNPLIDAGSESLKGYAEEAEAVGYILSEDQVNALAAVDDSYQQLQNTVVVIV